MKTEYQKALESMAKAIEAGMYGLPHHEVGIRTLLDKMGIKSALAGNTYIGTFEGMLKQVSKQRKT